MGVLASGAGGIPILMYHQVLPERPSAFAQYTVTARAFAAHMRWLSVAGYVPIGLDAVLASRAGGKALPRRAVVITFDDGFRGSYEYAVPTLQTFGFTATFYLVAGLMGAASRWLRRERGIEFPLMSWAEARGLQAMGFTCAGHTMTHARLAEVSDETCREELGRSREMLEQELGVPIHHLAYPFGSFRAETRAVAVELGYRTAVSVRIGLSYPDDDPLAMHRVPISGTESLGDFVCRVRTAQSVRGALQDVGRRAVGSMRRVAGRGAS